VNARDDGVSAAVDQHAAAEAIVKRIAAPGLLASQAVPCRRAVEAVSRVFSAFVLVMLETMSLAGTRWIGGGARSLAVNLRGWRRACKP
jgi:hypothetical protein